ncbi:GNAT family N-acetyltransferase [Poriferisphaera sp. WC338]|uniref:GNAT family N-acetyltransferase n=1 Tax=Poriferisphaera sp. WC338 TaxID=3425129 RepID=UPI003D818F55
MNEDELKLINPDGGMAEMFYAFCKAFGEVSGIAGVGVIGLIEGGSFAEKIERVLAMREGKDLPAGLVPCSSWWLVNDCGEMVGTIDLRHELSERLEMYGGHVGYAVHPDHRGKEYATYMLREVMAIAKAKGMGQLLITCDEDNVASQKVIKKCGGEYQDSVMNEGREVPTQRWWIECDQASNQV